MQAKGDAAQGTPKIVFYGAAHMLELLPAVDAVQVVRCKDCKNHGKCTFEDTFITVGINDGYCRVGAKMDGSISKAALSEAAAKARLEKPTAPDINRIIQYFEGTNMDGDDT